MRLPTGLFQWMYDGLYNCIFYKNGKWQSCVLRHWQLQITWSISWVQFCEPVTGRFLFYEILHVHCFFSCHTFVKKFLSLAKWCTSSLKSVFKMLEWYFSSILVYLELINALRSEGFAIIGCFLFEILYGRLILRDSVQFITVQLWAWQLWWNITYTVGQYWNLDMIFFYSIY